jgi:hypothetical protein
MSVESESKVKTVPDTKDWVVAFCRENNIRPDILTKQFFEAIADHAGRREGSWESYAIEDFVTGNGWAAIDTRFNGIGESI